MSGARASRVDPRYIRIKPKGPLTAASSPGPSYRAEPADPATASPERPAGANGALPAATAVAPTAAGPADPIPVAPSTPDAENSRRSSVNREDSSSLQNSAPTVPETSVASPPNPRPQGGTIASTGTTPPASPQTLAHPGRPGPSREPSGLSQPRGSRGPEAASDVKSPSPTTESLSTLSKDELIARLVAASAEKKTLLTRARRAEAALERLETALRSVLNCVILNPIMTHFYQQKLTVTLSRVLQSLDSITEVKYVNCSFPSIANDFPEVRLEEWKGLPSSLWTARWNPKWRVSCRVQGTHYLSFTLEIDIHSISVAGDLHIGFSRGLKTVSVAFTEMPQTNLTVDTSIALGILPIPLKIMRQSITSAVKSAFDSWLRNNLVLPSRMTFPCLRMRSVVSEEKLVEEARIAADMAQKRTTLS